MEFRNPKYNNLGTVDLELEHPVFGWVPFTASPDDPELYGRQIYSLALEGAFGEIAPCDVNITAP